MGLVGTSGARDVGRNRIQKRKEEKPRRGDENKEEAQPRLREKRALDGKVQGPAMAETERSLTEP